MAEPSSGKGRTQFDEAEMVDQAGGADVRDISEAGQAAVVTEAEVDKDAFKVEWWRPAFTRRREIFMARTAMAGFLSLQVGEILTGEGFFGQLSSITGVPKPILGLFMLVTVANNAITGLHPRSPTFSRENQIDVCKRNKLGVQQFISKPGFTKRNELNLGRVAMLGWAAALVGEALTGKGPAGQLGLQMESPLVRGGSLVLLLGWSGFWFLVARRLGTEGQLKGDTEIY
jgi:photosystem II protein